MPRAHRAATGRLMNLLQPYTTQARKYHPAFQPRLPRRGQQPQAEHRHGQQAQHLHRLAVQGVEVGDISLVAQDEEDGQLHQQVAPQGGQPEGAEQQEQQPGVAQQIDEAQHLDVGRCPGSGR